MRYILAPTAAALPTPSTVMMQQMAELKTGSLCFARGGVTAWSEPVSIDGSFAALNGGPILILTGDSDTHPDGSQMLPIIGVDLSTGEAYLPVDDTEGWGPLSNWGYASINDFITNSGDLFLQTGGRAVVHEDVRV